MDNRDSGGIRSILQTIVHAPTWETTRQIVTQHQTIVLTDTADTTFAAWIAEDANTQMLIWYREVLQHCRVRGIDATFDSLPEPRPLNKAIRVLINTDGSEALLEAIQNFPEMVSEAATKELQTLLTQVQTTDQEMAKKLVTHLDMIEMIKIVRHPISDELVQLLIDWMSTGSWDLSKEMLVANAEHLLSDAGFKTLNGLLLRSGSEAKAIVEILLQHQAILETARIVSIDAAYSQLVKLTPLERALQRLPNKLREAVQAIIAVNTINNLFEQIQRYPVLLTRQTHIVLEELLDELWLRDQEDVVFRLERLYNTLEYFYDLFNLLIQWINVDTWEQSQSILIANTEYLLTDEALKILDEVLLKDTNADENVIKTLQRHRTILETARAESIEAAYTELLTPPFVLALQRLPEDLRNALRAMIAAKSPDELLEQTQQYPILLQPQMKTAIGTLLDELREANDEDIVRHIEERYTTLKGFVFIPLPGSPDLKNLLVDWINTKAWDRSQAMLTANAERLLSDEALEILNTMLAGLRENETATHLLLLFRIILVTARAKSIEAAYALPQMLLQLRLVLQMFPGELRNALIKLLAVDDPDKLSELFLQQPILLDPQVMVMLDQSLDKLRNAGQQDAVHGLESMLDGLKRVIAAQHELQKTNAAVHALLTAKTLHKLQAAIAQHPMLFDDETLNDLSKLAEKFKQEGNIAAQRLHLRIKVIRHIRQQHEQALYNNTDAPSNRNEKATIYAEHGAIAIDTMYGDIYQIEHYAQPAKQWQSPKRQILSKTFVGRQTELDLLYNYLAAGENIAITGKTTSALLQGMAGIGKTYLALKLASKFQTKEFQANFPGGVIRITLGPQVLDEAATQAALRELAGYAFGGVPPLGRLHPELVAAWLEEMAPGRFLVLIDDVWHQKPLHFLEQALPMNAVRLVTTRNANVAQTLGGKIVSLDRLLPEDGLALLEDRLNCRDNTLYRSDLEALVKLLNGHALALDIAAGLIKNPSRLSLILQDLRKGSDRKILDRLKLPPSEERDENLEKSFALSYQKMTTKEQEYFRALGVFAVEAPIIVEAAAAVWGMEDADAALPVLSSLANLGLLTETVESTGSFYYQHSLLRTYARALLDEADELNSISWAHAAYCHEMVTFLAYPLLDRYQYIQNLLVALQWTIDNETTLFLDLFNTVCPFLERRGQITILETYLPQAVTAADTLGWKELQADFLVHWGEWESEYGNLEQARAHYIAALDLRRFEKDHLGEGKTLRLLGDLERRLGNFEQARTYYHELLPIFQAKYNQHVDYAYLLKSLGDLELQLHNCEQARKCYNDALPLFQANHHHWGEAHVLRSLGDLETMLDRFEQARSLYESSLSIYQAQGHRLGQANVYLGLGTLELELSNFERASTYFADALLLYQADHNSLGEANVYRLLIPLACKSGNIEQGHTFYENALKVYQREHNQFNEALLLREMGNFERQIGNLDQAHAHYVSALALFRSLNDHTGEASLLENLGSLARQSGDVEQGHTFYENALKVYQREHNRFKEANLLGEVGDFELQIGNLDQAHSYYVSALALFRSLNDHRGNASLLRRLGVWEDRMDNFEEARTHFDAALSLYHSLGSQEGEANLLLDLGNLERRLDNPEQARSHYAAALSLLRVAHDASMEAHLLTNMGHLECEQNQFDQARIFYNRALALYRTQYDRLGEANVLSGLGGLELQSENLDHARAIYDTALSLYRSVHNKLGEANTLWDLGYLECQIGNFEQAHAFYNQALSLFTIIQHKSGKLRTLISRGRTNFELGNYEQGTEDFQQAIALGHFIKDGEGAYGTELELVETLSKHGHYAEALERLQTMIQSWRTSERDKSHAAFAFSVYAGVLASLGQMEDALVAHNEAITLLPDTPLLRYNRAETLILVRQLEAAEVDLTHTVKLEGHENSPYLWYCRAESAIARGDGVLANRMLEEATKRDISLDVTLLQSQSAWLCGNVNIAHESLRHVLDKALPGERGAIRYEMELLLGEHPGLSGGNEIREMLTNT